MESWNQQMQTGAPAAEPAADVEDAAKAAITEIAMNWHSVKGSEVVARHVAPLIAAREQRARDAEAAAAATLGLLREAADVTGAAHQDAARSGKAGEMLALRAIYDRLKDILARAPTASSDLLERLRKAEAEREAWKAVAFTGDKLRRAEDRETRARYTSPEEYQTAIRERLAASDENRAARARVASLEAGNAE